MVRRLVPGPLVLAGCLLGAAPAAAQPKVVVFPPAGPAPAERLQQAKDEVELLDAQFAVRQAHVKAAEVEAAAAAAAFDRLAQRGAAVPQDQVEKAKADRDAARAKLDIRKAEADEVAVKLRHARRRAEAVAAAPPARSVAVFEASVQVAKARADAAAARAAVRKVKYDQSRGLSKKGVVSAIDVALAEAEYKEVEAELAVALAEVKVAEAALAAAQGGPVADASPAPPAVTLLLREADLRVARARATVAAARVEEARHDLAETEKKVKVGLETPDWAEGKARRLRTTEAGYRAEDVAVRKAEAAVEAARRLLPAADPRPGSLEAELKRRREAADIARVGAQREKDGFERLLAATKQGRVSVDEVIRAKLLCAVTEAMMAKAQAELAVTEAALLLGKEAAGSE